jgi:hypothetical protein
MVPASCLVLSYSGKTSSLLGWCSSSSRGMRTPPVIMQHGCWNACELSLLFLLLLWVAYTTSTTMAMTKHWLSWAKTVIPRLSASSKLVVKHRGTDAHPSSQICHDMQYFNLAESEWRNGCQQASDPNLSITKSLLMPAAGWIDPDMHLV